MQVRVSVAEQLLAMCAWGGGGGARGALRVLSAGGACGARLQRHARHAQQFLQLMCRLVALAGPTSHTREDLTHEVTIAFFYFNIFPTFLKLTMFVL